MDGVVNENAVEDSSTVVNDNNVYIVMGHDDKSIEKRNENEILVLDYGMQSTQR